MMSRIIASIIRIGVSMSVSTRKGDNGYTSLLRGERVPKYHPVTEAGGTLDEVNIK